MILVLRVISKGLTSEINFWPWPKFLNCTIKTWKIKSSRLSWVYCTTRKNTFQWAKRLPDEQKRITVVNIICSILFTNWIGPRYVSTYVLYYNFFFTKNVFKRHRWAPLKQIITIYNSFIAKKKVFFQHTFDKHSPEALQLSKNALKHPINMKHPS